MTPTAARAVAGPYGRGPAAYERAFRDISEALEEPLRRLAGTTLGG